ncbi:uncharacterized protein N7515_004331 [Penicillium bovifimosum]|uniref:Retrotransposon gag domain-containing protein n=1 Tax=Penicillium bovifimosum TaxID=126998 RepID=A0A9W9H1A3_9EURO|nr:uncharacterized protein N7515_004331 [Penicillium bovifimosum]KAJ5135053.1 hypothetical protein N7515_004331 [Penicillium bovifimosum]
MFSGDDRKEYDVFRMNLNTKFGMDAHFFPTEAKRVLYAFGRLTGKASQRMMPWMRSHGMPTKPYVLTKFYDEMDRAYGDSDRQQQALVRLHRLRQDKKDLREFLGEFDQELAEAGALEWSDSQKKAILERAVNKEILRPLIGRPTLEGDESYEHFCFGPWRLDYQL